MTPAKEKSEGTPAVGRDVGVAVPAAGSGQRMGGRKKPFLELAGVPVLLRAIRPFLGHPRVGAVRVALSREELASPPAWLLDEDPRIGLVPGGANRGDSVREALEALPDSLPVVMIHDAARPLVDQEIIERCLKAVGPARGAVAGWPAVDTLKEVDESGRIVATPARERIWHAQTPQAFPRKMVLEAYRRAAETGTGNTDDAALVEAVGGKVVMVRGGPYNLKITRPHDLALAGFLLGRMGE